MTYEIRRPENSDSYEIPDGHEPISIDDFDKGITFSRKTGVLHFYDQPFAAASIKLDKLVNISVVVTAASTLVSSFISLSFFIFTYLNAKEPVVVKSSYPFHIVVDEVPDIDFYGDEKENTKLICSSFSSEYVPAIIYLSEGANPHWICVFNNSLPDSP